MGTNLRRVHGRRLLVVDDDAGVCQMLTTYLQREMPNSEVRHACDGLAGLKLFLDWEPHILFTDINMPNMDGLELLMRVNMEQPKTRVVVFTARDDREASIQVLTHGAADYLHKPLEMQEFLLACQRAIDHLELIEGLDKRIEDLEQMLAVRDEELLKLKQPGDEKS